MSGGGESEVKLEYTATWIVAGVCSVIVFVSLFVERLIHFLGKALKRKNQKPLYDALQKIKEELMLLGFISLMLVACQTKIQQICIPERFTRHLVPCQLDRDVAETGHFVSGIGRRRLLLAGGSASTHCANSGKVPLLSLEAIHQLHIFIFVLAVTHVVLSVLTMLLGGAKIRQWKRWEDAIQKDGPGTVQAIITQLNKSEFIKERFWGIGKDSSILSWMHSFVKQFYGSVTKSDYSTMRLGFIMMHCRGNQNLNFHKYMMRALEADFKKVVGISWYLWSFVVVFLLLNIHGWHIYFWISFVPLALLLALGTKLGHIISQMAQEVAEKHSAVEGDLVVRPSDDHFWFHKPKIVLLVIRFILFQNAFEISVFFWIWNAYGFDSCIMGHIRFTIPRLLICMAIQILCSYSTLPLYAIVTQMGSSFRGAIFDENVKEGLLGWAQMIKNRKARSRGTQSATTELADETSVEIQIQSEGLVDPEGRTKSFLERVDLDQENTQIS